MNIFIVIPIHNEEKHILKVLNGVSKQKLQIIAVDDGSTDSSLLKINKSNIPRLSVLHHKINLGKGSAMRSGADYAFSHGAEAVIFMDADGQHNPQNIKLFIKVLNTNLYDVVFGSRGFEKDAPPVRYAGNKIASFIINFLFGIYVSDPICGFRAITKKAYGKVRWNSSGYGVESEILARVKKNLLKYTEIPVDTIYFDRQKGVTMLDAIGIFGDVLKLKLTI